jgi:hypothetical protein
MGPKGVFGYTWLVTSWTKKLTQIRSGWLARWLTTS